MLTEDAKKTLQQVITFIEREPKRMRMDFWFGGNIPSLSRDDGGYWCGTVGCIAGWVVALSRGRKACLMNVSGQARSILGLDHETAQRLFLHDQWPEPFRRELWCLATMPGTPEYASEVAARIRFFIETDGTDDPNMRRRVSPAPVEVKEVMAEEEELVCV